MNFTKTIFITAIILFSAFCIQAQTGNKKIPPPNNQAAKFSPAYAEILLRKTERESELEELLIAYTEEFPKVKEIKFELTTLQKEMDKVLTVNSSEAAKLTLALGKLIVRKTELETDLWNLRRQYNDENTEVKRTKRKIEVFEKAIKEILP